MAVSRAAVAVFAFSVLASRLAANTVETDSQSDDCQVAAPAGDVLLERRKDVMTQASAREEAALHDEARHGSGAAKQQRQQLWLQEAAVVAGKARSNTINAVESHVDKVPCGMCKNATLHVIRADADALSAQNSTIYPFVKVSYKSQQSENLTYDTDYKKVQKNSTHSPVVWDHMKEVLLCDKEQPLNFEIYNEGYFSNTLLVKAKLDAFLFWEHGFNGNVKLEDGAKGYMSVAVAF